MAIAYIVTGTTRGIGSALAQQIIAGDDLLLSLSSAANHEATRWQNLQCDLSDPENVAAGIERLVQSPLIDSAQAVVLINNAGVLVPMGPIASAADEQIVQHVLINQAAPAMLISSFIRLTESLVAQRRIINISSGAARHPYAGWALYCASKAALEMMTLSVAAEQAICVNPVVVCAVSPGKVETDMQRRIRSSSPAIFPAQPDFVDAKRRGKIKTPEAVAGMILALDRAGLLHNGKLYDLRDVKQQAGGLRIDPIET